jgi:hypothetical protein
MVQIPIQLSTSVLLSLELGENMVPHTRLGPAVQAGGDALPGTKLLRQIAPGCSRTVDPQDGLDHGAMVLGGAARFLCLWWQKRTYLLPLLVGQYLSCHTPSLVVFENGS